MAKYNLITILWAFWSRNFRKIIILCTALKVAKSQRITLISALVLIMSPENAIEKKVAKSYKVLLSHIQNS